MSQFKIVQDFVERCHWNYHFFCFRMLYLSYMENIPAHRDLFHFYRNVAVDASTVEEIVRDGKE